MLTGLKPEDFLNKDLIEEYKHFKKTGRFRCLTCKKKFIKCDEYEWKPNCKHHKNIRMSKG